MQIAKLLMQVRAVKLRPEKPFTWASGWKSPIYCDNRITLSYPQIRTFIRQEFVKTINDEIGDVDLIAGVATGGIGMGALVAQELGLPFAYVRSTQKEHGLSNQIEGVVESGQRVVVIEDLISTGGSSLKAVEALRSAGCDVKGLIAIFSYNFDVAIDAFKAAKCKMLTLSNYNALVEQALADEFILEKDLISLKKWRKDPANWGK
ncbi:MAG: orotate phosphoribosyltransferase [Bacteroidales bacterium]|nr:orotate phosphoribosyltransferase [Bacteroidales bacterium]